MQPPCWKDGVDCPKRKAYETRVQAEAEAEANAKIAASITDALIDYVQAQNWDGKLPATYLGSDSTVPIINTDNSFANAFQ